MAGNFPFPGQAVEAADFTVALLQGAEVNAGPERSRLTAEEEQDLALLIRDGQAAQKVLPDIEEQMYEAAGGVMPDWLTETKRSARATVRKGEEAEQRLIGRNLDLARELALASTVHPGEEGKP